MPRYRSLENDLGLFTENPAFVGFTAQLWQSVDQSDPFRHYITPLFRHNGQVCGQPQTDQSPLSRLAYSLVRRPYAGCHHTLLTHSHFEH